MTNRLSDTEKTPKKSEPRLDVFPAFFKVRDRRVLVVGRGAEAAAKVRLLGETNARIEVVSADIMPALREAIDAVGAVHIAEDFHLGLLKDAALVFSAREDEALDKAVVDAARIMGVPVNAVDKPELCDFYTGALVNRAPVAIAITSTGVGPVLARHIRARIEAMLPRATGELARLAESFRDTVFRVIRDGAGRRRFWAQFFSGPVAMNLYAGRTGLARAEAQRLLNGQTDGTGFVWLVGAGPGAEDLLTLRAQRLLQEADVIVHDALVPASVVAMGRRDAERISFRTTQSVSSINVGNTASLLAELALEGCHVVLLEAGDCRNSAQTRAVMARLGKAGIGYEVIPGVAVGAVSSAIAA